MIKVVNSEDFQKIITMSDAIETMRDLYSSLDKGRFDLPPHRTILSLKENSGYALAMPSYISELDAISVKVSTIIPNNKNIGLPLSDAVVIFVNAKNGQIEMILDGRSLTAMRTGAMCGLATSLLAPLSAKSMTIIGAGIQARSVLKAVMAIRNIEYIKIYSRQKEASINLKKHIQEVYKVENIDIFEDPNGAVLDVDIICTCTSNALSLPVFTELKLKKNVHINAIGGPSTDSLEIPVELYRNALVVVEEKGIAKRESGEIKLSYKNAYIDDDSLFNIGTIINGPSITGHEGVTIFRSVGMSIQDTALADKIYRKINNFDLPSISLS